MTVLINPHAGSKAISAPAIATALQAAGADPDIQQADGARLRAHVLDELNDGSRIIIAAGGDGTVSTVASALTGTDVALGVLPLGTLNHLRKICAFQASSIRRRRRSLLEIQCASMSLK